MIPSGNDVAGVCCPDRLRWPVLRVGCSTIEASGVFEDPGADV